MDGIADAFALANAFVRIRPTATGFRAEADTEIKSAMAGAQANVKIGADSGGARMAAADLRTYLNGLAQKVYQFRLVTDDKDAQARLTSLYGQLLRLDKTVSSPKLTIAGVTRVQAALLGIDASMDRISKNIAVAHVEIEDGDTERRLALLVAQITALTVKTNEVKLDVNDGASEIILAALVSRLTSIREMASQIDFRLDTDQLAQAEGEVARLAADFMALTAAEDVVAEKTRSFGGLFSTIMKVLTTQVDLFGGVLPGMLGEVAVWHIILDLLIEFAAVLGPAIIAMGVFGAVAVPTLRNIFTQMKNVHTVTVATGQALYPVSGGFQKLAAAVQPSVYQLFGDALTLMNSKSGTLANSLKQTGSVLDGFGARIAVALQSGNAGNFFTQANSDLKHLGDELGNIFGIIGNIAKTVPGYAEVLLNAFDGLSKSVENITGSKVTQTVLGWGLAFHGAYLYTGLLGTALAFMATKGLTLVAGLAEKASFALSGFGGVAQKASLGLGRLAESATGAAALPWAWIAVAAAAIGILTYKILTARDATQQWFDSLEKALMASSAVKGLTVLQQDQALVAGKLAVAQKAAATSTGNLTKAISSGSYGAMLQYTAAAGNANEKTQDLSAAQMQITNQAILYNTRLSSLTSAFGGLGAAQGILVASGITMQQMLTKGVNAWEQILQQVSATDAAYRAMGQTQGILGADMNVLNIAASQQVTQMTNLNKAFDTVIGIVSGGQSTFITFEQSLAATVKAGAAAGASMTGLGGSSLALRQAFQTSYTDASKMLDALRLMVATSPNAQSGSFPVLTASIKDTLLQLIPFGQHSAATQAELVSLAQEVNPAIQNFQQLQQWLGKSKDPAKDLDKQLSNLGVDMQSLSKDASGLYTSLQNNIINQFNIAKLAGSGVSQAVKMVGEDVGNLSTKSSKTITDIGTLAKSFQNAKIGASDASSMILAMVGHISLAGETAAQKHQSLVNLYNDFHNAGFSAQEAAKLVHTLTGEVLQIPKSATVNVYLRGSGSGRVSVTESLLPGSAAAAQESLIFGNRGYKLPGYGGGDKHPAMLEAGETIVPKHLTPMVAPLMKKHGVPGFASGGIIGTSLASLGAQAASVPPFGEAVEAHFGTAVMTQFANAVMSKARADLDKQVKDNAAGPGGGAPAANAALARKLMPSWASGAAWSAWNSVAMRESGWNQFARNPSSGAYGIPQALPASKMGTAANPPQSNPTAQIRWMIGYIQGRYGNPQGAWQHELDVGWYAKGTGGGPAGGARPGWGMVGERGQELVLFHGGEHVVSNVNTRKIMAGHMGLPGYADGTPVKAPTAPKPPTAAQKLKAARLKELAADVAKENKLVKARTAHRKTLALGIYQQELYDIQHPKDKGGPVKLKKLEKANTAYLASSGKPIILLQKEVALLRALTGEPKGALYGATTTAATSTSTGTSSTGTSAGGTSAGGTSAAAQAAALAAAQAQAAQELVAFAAGILPTSGNVAGGQSGISVGSASGATASGTATSSAGGLSSGSGGTIGSLFPTAAGPRVPAGGPPASGVAPSMNALIARMDQLISVTRAIPAQQTAGFNAVLGGVARGARQSGRFNTRG